MDVTDYTKLPKDLQDKLKKWEANRPENQQLQVLSDLAVITQESLNVLDAIEKSGQTNAKQYGALLTDIREKLSSLDGKEAPETPDYAKPVLDGIKQLEKALTASIKGIDVKPVVNVPKLDAPAVNVTPPSIDLKGVEKILKTDLPKAFKEAIKLIPKDKEDKDYTQKFDEMLDWLKSIDTASRKYPQAPTTVKVTNTDGTAIGSSTSKATAAYSIVAISDDGTYKYFWFEDADLNYYIMRKTLATSVFTYTKGTGGYSAVYQSSILGPSGSPTFSSYGNTF